MDLLFDWQVNFCVKSLSNICFKETNYIINIMQSLLVNYVVMATLVNTIFQHPVMFIFTRFNMVSLAFALKKNETINMSLRSSSLCCDIFPTDVNSACNYFDTPFCIYICLVSCDYRLYVVYI